MIVWFRHNDRVFAKFGKNFIRVPKAVTRFAKQIFYAT